MATILFSAADADPSLVANFSATADQLVFDNTVSAANVQVVPGANAVTLSVGGSSVTLPIAITAITPTNINFTNGTALLVGDLQSTNVTDDLTNLINIQTVNSNAFAGDNVKVYGLGGNDSVTSSTGSEVIYGNTGDDTITTSTQANTNPGSDVLYGGQGNDSIDFSGITVTTAGAVLYGNVGNDVLTGGNGVDVLYGGQGNDTLTATGAGDDNLYGGVGDDSMTGTAGNNELWGGDGADTITGNTGADTVVAGDGDDRITLGAGNDSVLGGAGNDSITTDAGDDIIYGNQGADTITAGDGQNTVFGGKDADVVTGGANVDVLYGNIGNDTLSGAAGDDRLYGGQDADSLSGGADSDALYGGTGADTLNAGVDAGADTLSGGEGSDVFQLAAIGTAADGANDDVITDFGSGDSIVFSAGQTSAAIFTNTFDDGTGTVDLRAGDFTDGDRLNVISGSDLVLKAAANGQLTLSNAASATLNGSNFQLGSGQGVLSVNILGTASTVEGGTGADRLVGSEQGDTISGLAGDDVLVGGSSGDSLNGGAGADSIFGFAGNDTILTGAGVDYAFGGVGDDFLYGGADADSLNGGDGADTLFAAGAGDDRFDGAAGNDVIVFNAGEYTGNDTINGGDGTDTIQFNGGTGGVQNLNNTTNIEQIVLTNTGAANLATADATVGATATLTVDGTATSGANLVTFDGSSETDGGRFIINGGAGDDVLTAGDGADTINSGAGNDAVNGDSGADTLILGLGNDTVIVSDGDLDNDNRVTVTDFSVTDDSIRIDETLANGGTGNITDGVSAAEFLEAAAGNVTVGANQVVVELNYAFDADVDLDTASKADILSALGAADNSAAGVTAGTFTFDAAGDEGLVIAYQDGNAYLFEFISGLDADITTVDADDIVELVGVYNGVAVGAFTNADFIA